MNIMFSIFFIILSAVLTKLFCVIAQKTSLMDVPNERSMHIKPTVRGGGIIFISIPLLTIPFLSADLGLSLSEWYALLFSAIVLAGVSFLDDLYTLSIRPRLLVQLFVASLMAIFLKPDQLDFLFFTINNTYFIALFVLFSVLWAINHFNFMDGIDGFCASQALFLFGAYAILFGLYKGPVYQEWCLVFIGSLLGFLIFNFPPAKLFMGDVGSATLGFIIFCLALIAQQHYHIPIIFWLILNFLFLFDATITLIRRVLKKERFFAAHKKHAYQRLKQFGISNRTILLGQFMINSVFLAVVLLCYMHIHVIWLVVFQSSVIFLMYYLIEKHVPMFEKMDV